MFPQAQSANGLPQGIFRFMILAVFFAFLATGCPPPSQPPADEQREGDVPGSETTTEPAERDWDLTINVNDPGATYDIGGVCSAATIDMLPGPDGVVTLHEALCAANDPTRGRFRIQLDLAPGQDIVGTPAGARIPPPVSRLEANEGAPVRIVAPAEGRREGLYVAGRDDRPLVIRGLEFNGFVSTALWIDSETKGPIRIENCTFTANERGIYHEGERLEIRNCLFSRNRLIGIKTRGRHVSIEDSRFEYTGTVSPDHGSYGIFVENTADVVVRNSHFQGNTGVVEISWSIFCLGATNCRILENVFRENRAQEIHLDGCSQCLIEGNQIAAGPGSKPASAAIRLSSGCRNNRITGNRIEPTAGRGIELRCAAETEVTGNAISGGRDVGINWIGCRAIAGREPDLIDGNRISGQGKAAIFLGNGRQRTRPPVVTRNVLDDNRTGIELTGSLAGAIIRENRVSQSVGYGIYIDLGTDGVVVEGNVVTDSGTDGIHVQSRGNTIVGNRCQDNTLSQIHVQVPYGQERFEDNVERVVGIPD